MQDILSIALAVTGGLAVFAAIPQLIQMIKVKSSDEFSIFSWSIWLLYQLVALAYTMSINELVYVAINGLWVIFYSAMVWLILRYRFISLRKNP